MKIFDKVIKTKEKMPYFDIMILNLFWFLTQLKTKILAFFCPTVRVTIIKKKCLSDFLTLSGHPIEKSLYLKQILNVLAKECPVHFIIFLYTCIYYYLCFSSF